MVLSLKKQKKMLLSNDVLFSRVQVIEWSFIQVLLNNHCFEMY
jgi:hypothetical protein